jgi:sec-independent protein translocase protein TatA
VFNIGPTELIVVLVIALIVFGPRRLPEVGRTVGKSLREFRKASQDLRDELNINLDEDDPPATRPAPGEPGYANWQSAKPSGNGATDATEARGPSQEGTGGEHAS